MKTFAIKSAVLEKHGELDLKHLPSNLPKLLLVRRRWIIADCLAAHELTPICMIARGILQQGVWPALSENRALFHVNGRCGTNLHFLFLLNYSS